jgi:integrase/recombinase XerD
MVTALKTLFDGFCLAKEANGVRPRTLEAYRLMYQALVRDLPPEKLADASTLTVQDLQEWAISLRKRLATATVDQRIAKAKAFFNWCVTEGFLETNPIASVKRPKKNWQPDPLSEEEITALLDAARYGRASVRNTAILCTLLDSGLRNTELCRLKVGDVSLKTGQLHVREGMKGGKPRTVLIGRKAKEALWRWMMQRPDGAEFLFCTEQGRPLDRTRLRVIVNHLGQRAGVSRCYPHRLRHTFALLYLKGGGDPYTLQYLLGHEDMTVTREYVKIAAQDAREMYRSPLDALRK